MGIFKAMNYDGELFDIEERSLAIAVLCRHRSGMNPVSGKQISDRIMFLMKLNIKEAADLKIKETPPLVTNAESDDVLGRRG